MNNTEVFYNSPNYPPLEVYEKLYARFFKRDVGELFSGIDVKDKTVLDLCCGNGRASFKALELGAKNIIAVDGVAHMISEKLCDNPKIGYSISSVEMFLHYARFKWDIVVCQQAINYWFNNINLKDLVNVIMPGGVFIFNTFNRIPSTKPTVKSYQLNGHDYVEVSYLVDGKVHHFQSMDGCEPHLTTFDWISPDLFVHKLDEYFKWQVLHLNSTSIWQCFRK